MWWCSIEAKVHCPLSFSRKFMADVSPRVRSSGGTKSSPCRRLVKPKTGILSLVRSAGWRVITCLNLLRGSSRRNVLVQLISCLGSSTCLDHMYAFIHRESSWKPEHTDSRQMVIILSILLFSGITQLSCLNFQCQDVMRCCYMRYIIDVHHLWSTSAMEH